MSNVKISVIAASAAAIFAGSASANVLQNSGFEAGSGADADNWAEILAGPAGFVGRSSAMPNSGAFSAYMSVDHVNNAAAGGAYFIEQNLPVGSIDPSLDYDLSFFAKSDSTDFTGINMFVQILWLDQDGSNGGGVQGEMLTSLVDLGINDSYQQFSMDALDVPGGADSVLLRFQLSAGAVDGIMNGLYVDDVSLTAIPAPSSAALLAFGGLAATRRRR